MMQPSKAGTIVRRTWESIPERFPAVELISFALMPNHIHGVIAIMGSNLATGKGRASLAPTKDKPSLAAIVGAFKSLSTIAVNRARGSKVVAIWQRNYFEHIERGGQDLQIICRYISENPSRWNGREGDLVGTDIYKEISKV
jgi:putative transposase